MQVSAAVVMSAGRLLRKKFEHGEEKLFGYNEKNHLYSSRYYITLIYLYSNSTFT